MATLKSVELSVDAGAALYDCRVRAIKAAAEHKCDAWFVHNERRYYVRFTDLFANVKESSPDA